MAIGKCSDPTATKLVRRWVRRVCAALLILPVGSAGELQNRTVATLRSFEQRRLVLRVRLKQYASKVLNTPLSVNYVDSLDDRVMREIETEIAELERMAAEYAEPESLVVQRQLAFSRLAETHAERFVAYREHWDPVVESYGLEIIAEDASEIVLRERIKQIDYESYAIRFVTKRLLAY